MNRNDSLLPPIKKIIKEEERTLTNIHVHTNARTRTTTNREEWPLMNYLKARRGEWEEPRMQIRGAS